MNSYILDISVRILVDTGASCNVLKKEIVNKLKEKRPSIKPDESGTENSILRSFTGSDIKSCW